MTAPLPAQGTNLAPWRLASLVQAHVVRFAPNRHSLKPQRGLRPVVGQTQQPLTLLFGLSPGGPPEAISCVFVIFVDRGHGAPP